MTEPAPQKLSENFKLKEASTGEGEASDCKLAETTGTITTCGQTKQAGDKTALMTIARENTEDASKGNTGADSSANARSDNPDISLYTIATPKPNDSGMRRHRLIVSACLVTAATIFALSAMDLKPLIETAGQIDKSLHFTATPRPAKLPPDLTYTNEPSVDGLHKVATNGWGQRKFGYVNQLGKVIVPLNFSRLEKFSDGLAAAFPEILNSHLAGYIDKTGRFVIQPRFGDPGHFKNGLAIVYEDGVMELIDKSGKIVFKAPKAFNSRGYRYETGPNDLADAFDQKELNPQGTRDESLFPDISQTLRRVGQLYIVRDQSGREQLLDKNANVLTTDDINSIIPMNADTTNGVTDSRDNYLNGLIDRKDGDVDFLKFRSKEKWGLMDASGKQMLPAKYQRILSYNKGHAAVCIDNKYGFVDATGKMAIKPEYDYVTAYDDVIAAKKDGEWKFIDGAGNEIKGPKVDGIIHTGNGYWFSDGAGAVLINNKVGFIDKSGFLIIQPKYEWAYTFKNGLAPVWDGRFWHYINKSGKPVGMNLADTESFSAGKTAAALPGILYPFAGYRNIEAITSRVKNMQNQVSSTTHKKPHPSNGKMSEDSEDNKDESSPRLGGEP